MNRVILLRKQRNAVVILVLIASLLLFLSGCGDSPAESRTIIVKRPITQEESTTPEKTTSEVETSTKEDTYENVTNSIIEARPLEEKPETYSERSSEEGLDESTYLTVELSSIAHDHNLPTRISIPENWLQNILLNKSDIRRDLINKSITFDSIILPYPTVQPDYEICGFILFDDGKSMRLFNEDILNNFSLCCNFTNFVAESCGTFEMFGKYSFYGVLRENVSEWLPGGQHRGFWDYIQLLELHKIVKIESPPAKFASIKNGYDCVSDADCGWVSVNCCSEKEGANWYCINKKMEDYLCEYRSPHGLCNEGVFHKPSSSCTCQENKCVAE